MIVYVLIWTDGCDDSGVWGVYSTEEKARKRARIMDEGYHPAGIEVWEVDSDGDCYKEYHPL